MDSITQATLGAAVSYIGLEKQMGRKALLLGAALGTLPDLDSLFTSGLDIVNQLYYHRGFSHSIVFAALAAYPLAWLFKCRHLRGVITIFLILLTHSLLDACTTWGTQLFWPLPSRIALKNIFIIDPIYTLALLIPILILCVNKTFKKPLYWGLAISSIYLVFGLCAKHVITNRINTVIKQENIAPLQVEVKATTFNTILWSGIIETEHHFYYVYSSLLSKNISPLYKSDKNQQLPQHILDHPKLKKLLFLMNGLYTIKKDGEDHLIQDLRFSRGTGWEKGEGESVFTYRIQDKDDQLIVHQERFRNRDYKTYFKPFQDYILGRFQSIN